MMRTVAAIMAAAAAVSGAAAAADDGHADDRDEVSFDAKRWRQREEQLRSRRGSAQWCERTGWVGWDWEVQWGGAPQPKNVRKTQFSTRVNLGTLVWLVIIKTFGRDFAEGEGINGGRHPSSILDRRFR